MTGINKDAITKTQDLAAQKGLNSHLVKFSLHKVPKEVLTCWRFHGMCEIVSAYACTDTEI